MLNTESSQDLQLEENIKKKNFPKLTPRGLWDTFPIAQSTILSEMRVSAGFSEYEKHEIWGIFTI